MSALGALRAGLRVPRTHRAVLCVVCGRKGLATEDYFIHGSCQGTPRPCECGEPSMPYPLCRWCVGTGRIEGEICFRCPPGPCVGCAAKALLARCREPR